MVFCNLILIKKILYLHLTFIYQPLPAWLAMHGRGAKPLGYTRIPCKETYIHIHTHVQKYLKYVTDFIDIHSQNCIISSILI